jgi:two-component system nitrogen regulation sensor histidine kinase NtrY
MTLRQKLLLTIAGLVVLAVAAVAWTVSLRTRKALEAIEQQRSAALLAQVRGEFQHQGDAIAMALQRMAADERVQRIAFDATHGGDINIYVPEAATLAREYQLDFLELVNSDGVILSSAQAPARFGYREQLAPGPGPFLQNVETNEEDVLGMICQRALTTGNNSFYLIGGRKLDAEFIRSLPLPGGMYVWFYASSQPRLEPQKILSSTPVPAENLGGIISAALVSGNEVHQMVTISNDRLDHADVQAVPMKDQSGAISAVLLVGVSRRPTLELLQHIRAIAYAVAGTGILLAIFSSLWISGVFSRPIEQLAGAAREVAAGNWDVRVAVNSRDELQQLAEAFNAMTRELLQQRERLLQAERVAAWRELARRLAHDLKNPLFPLQITVENLVRARGLPAQEFDEVFEECARTLSGEILHLKAIIGRFSDFSKMPQPELQRVDVNALVEKAAALHRAQLQESAHPVSLVLELDPARPQAMLDPELMHRVLSNLLLNALDAMPEGGRIQLATRSTPQAIEISVSDSGIGLTPEERDRLFTPYYTSKQHGTGLGLAIVQSVVSDHGGRISVNSEPGCGATFTISIPQALEHNPGDLCKEARA